MVELKNERLLVEIDPHGAEIKRVYHLDKDLEFMWHGDPEYWGRTAPVLFPIVGRVAKDHYLHHGQTYQLGQHGFARDSAFAIDSQTEKEVWFSLTESDASLAKYPFRFNLKIGYILEGDSLSVKWEVANPNEGELPFSIGAHPAFSTALEPGDELSDYYLHLEHNEGIETYIFDDENGLVTEEKAVIMEGLKLLPLSRDLFEAFPTIVLEGETGLLLKSYNHDHEVGISFKGFPYVGIWSPVVKDKAAAPFVCLEPWFGLADSKAVPQEISAKKGVITLAGGETFDSVYTMTFR